MKGGPLIDVAKEYGDTSDFRRMSELTASIKHLSIECDGQFYKFDSFDNRSDAGSCRIQDRDGQEISMMDAYHKQGKTLRLRNGPVVCTTGKFIFLSFWRRFFTIFFSESAKSAYRAKDAEEISSRIVPAPSWPKAKGGKR